MSTFRMIVLLIVMPCIYGCSPSELELERANQTIVQLRKDIQELKSQNMSLANYQEMAIGEVAFTQGCRLWINTCFGQDEIGGQLLQEGLSAQGSVQYFLWMSSKIIFLSLTFTTIAGFSVVFMNWWITPSFTRQQRAVALIEQAREAHVQIEEARALSLADVKSAAASAIKEEAVARHRLEALRSDIFYDEDERERLLLLIQELKQEVSALELAKVAAAAFSKSKSR